MPRPPGGGKCVALCHGEAHDGLRALHGHGTRRLWTPTWLCTASPRQGRGDVRRDARSRCDPERGVQGSVPAWRPAAEASGGQAGVASGPTAGVPCRVPRSPVEEPSCANASCC